jgi:hypothetical protein
MADTLGSVTREVGVAKSTILRLIRPSAPASNPETAALRAECEGLRLALSLAQEALREERADKEHWRDEAKHLRELLGAPKPGPKIISPEPETISPPPSEATVVDAPALAPVAEADRLRSSRCMRHARHPFHTTVAGVRPPERTLVPRLANTGPRISPDPCFWDQSRQSELKGNWRSIAMDPTPVSSR